MSAEHSDSSDDALSGAAARAAEVLRAEVPVRAAWRDALLARIEQDERLTARRGRWTIAPPMAIAAGIALVMLGAGGAVVLGRHRLMVPAAPTAPTIGSTQSVRFVLVAPGAAQVSVVGDFNQWTAGAVLLHQLDDGRTWIADVPLSPGRYAYAFVVDGRVVVDPAAPHATSDAFGVANSIVMVRGL
jgi:hypothetical protein